MNPVIKEKWVAALRSGEYTQGTGVLNRLDEEFCCLGVLCEIALKEGVDIEKALEPMRDYEVYTYGGSVYCLPDEVERWSGLDQDELVPHPVDDRNTTLAAVNDSKVSFTVIADIIEEYF
jgi:hypothetical protein